MSCGFGFALWLTWKLGQVEAFCYILGFATMYALADTTQHDGVPRKYTFRTRPGRWLHCLVNLHQPLTVGPEKNGKKVYGCLQCLQAHDRVVAKLRGKK